MDEGPGEVRRRDPLRDEEARDPGPAESAAVGDLAPSGDEVAAARTEIERTRARMSETANEIQERLDPQNLEEQAKAHVKERARDTGSGLLETIRQNPIPTAIFAGLGLLLIRRLRR